MLLAEEVVTLAKEDLEAVYATLSRQQEALAVLSEILRSVSCDSLGGVSVCLSVHRLYLVKHLFLRRS